MPIYRERDAMARLPEIGRFALGAEKPKDKGGAGLDLPYFRLRLASPSVVAAVEAVYQKEPTELRVLFTETTAEGIIGRNARMALYGGGGTKIECNLKRIVRKRVNGRLVDADDQCQFNHDENKCALGCKPDIRLTFMLHGIGRLGGVFVVKTTSWINYDELTANLIEAEKWTARFDELLNDLPAGQGTPNLGGVIFVLRKGAKTVNYVEEGKSKTSKKNLLSLEIDPEWMKQAMHRIQERAYGIEAPKATPLLVSAEAIEQHDAADRDRDDDDAPPTITIKKAPERQGVSHEEATDLLASNDYTKEDGQPTTQLTPAAKLSSLVDRLTVIREGSTSRKQQETNKDALGKLIDDLKNLVAEVGLDYEMDRPATFVAAITEASTAIAALQKALDQGVVSPV